MRSNFIEKARIIHNDVYDYSQAVFTTSKEKVIIRCKIHGEFRQSPEKHIRRKQGCPECGKIKQRSLRKYTLQEFLDRARSVHGSTYDYSRVVYSGVKTPVEIICPRHGSFFTSPEYHFQGRKCLKCRKTRAYPVDIFIAKATIRHNSKYDYSKIQYKNLKEKITVVCPTHGAIQIRPDHHLMGVGCIECGNIQRVLKQQKSQTDFLADAQKIHGNRYNYSKSKYCGAKKKIEIVCKLHGSFWQEANSHQRGLGCPTCVNHHTKPQKEIEAWLQSLGVSFIVNTRKIIPPKELDIFIPEKCLAIELNGTYWHSLRGTESAEEKFAHRNKFTLCQKAGITLLQIDENEWRNPIKQSVWKSIIESKLGKHQCVFARKTIFKDISREEAVKFLEQYHLQGASLTSRWHFGLFRNSELLAVMTFSRHQKNYLNLNRMAFKSGISVTGGAHKLFSNALKYLPADDIVTFSNHRYSQGKIYEVLGFSREAELAPSYQWFYKNRLYDKRYMRHNRIAKLIDNYDPTETEHQNMYRHKARCLYDAGYSRWVFKRK